MFFSKPAKNGGGVTSLTGTPTEIVYIDNAGVGTSDALATRDSVTNETYIGYRTSGGDFSNALKLGNFIGSFITDGTGFERHDAVNDNFTFSAAIDGTPISATTNTLLQGYVDITNGVFATGTYNADEAALDYSNSVTGIDGYIVVKSTEISIEHTDNSTYDSQIEINNTIDLKTDGVGGRNLFRVSDTFIRGGSNGFYFYADTTDDTFYVRGELPTTGTPSGALLFVDFPSAIAALGDYNKQMSQIKVVADVANKNAYIDGLASPVVNWTPTFLSDGFTGSGLNDMHYDSTITYTGSYPRTYTSTISATDCVYLLLTSIISPSFNAGDTVTDPVSGSTGTVLAGSDLDLYLIIQPIIDSGWNTATQVDDTTTGGSANCSFQRYTDTFDWNDGTTFVTYIDTNTFVPLNDGLTVGFYSPTGHTIGDTWEFTMIQGTVYSKMALFDGANRTMSIGDVEQTVNDVRTDWVLGTGKNHGIYEYLGDAQEYRVSNSVGNILVLDSDTFNQTVIFSIEDPFNGQTPFSVETDSGAYGFGFQLFDAGQHSATLGAPTVGNNTFLTVDDDNEIITLTASHISAPLSAYADDADAGTNGVVTGELYQTDGTGTAPLNIAGIVMVKQ